MGMKVLHLIDSGGLYGAEKMLLTLVKEQINQGIEPLIVSAGEHQHGEKAIAIEAKSLGLPVVNWFMKPGLNLKEARKIISWARANNYSILHSHGYKFNILLGVIPRRFRSIPLVSTLHGYVKAPCFSKMWLYECLDKWVLSSLSGVAIVGEAMKSQLPSSLRESSSLKVIRNGLDLDNAEASINKPLDETIREFIEKQYPLILGVGRLSAEKGFEQLVDAFPFIRDSFPHAGLLIIGEGPQRSLIEEKALRNGIDAFMLPGYYPDILSVMSKATVLVMPSRTEGLPVTLLEAMSVGCPVAVTDVGEMSSVVQQGEGGTILENTLPKSLGNELIGVLKNEELRKKQVARSLTAVRENYSASSMAADYKNFYESAL